MRVVILLQWSVKQAMSTDINVWLLTDYCIDRLGRRAFNLSITSFILSVTSSLLYGAQTLEMMTLLLMKFESICSELYLRN